MASEGSTAHLSRTQQHRGVGRSREVELSSRCSGGGPKNYQAGIYALIKLRDLAIGISAIASAPSHLSRPSHRIHPICTPPKQAQPSPAPTLPPTRASHIPHPYHSPHPTHPTTPHPPRYLSLPIHLRPLSDARPSVRRGAFAPGAEGS